MEKYLICTDIDGTLITSDQQVPPKTLALLQELIAQGHHFAVSTGRMFQSANKFARLVDESGNVICSNGSVVSSGGETLFRQGLDPESIQTVFDICTLHQVPLFFFFREHRLLYDDATFLYYRRSRAGTCGWNETGSSGITGRCKAPPS